MSIVYVVHGWSACDLYLDPQTELLLWTDYGRLIAGGFRAMRLAADGASPGGPDGRQLYVGGFNGDQWFGALDSLRTQLLPRGWFREPFAWDWRQSIVSAGIRLANAIRDNTEPPATAKILAHSAGGLVARVAWSHLNEIGDAGLIDRIVTMGTPHGGTYSAVQILSGVSDFTDQMTAFAASASLIGPGALGTAALARWTLDDFINVAATWPSLYELLPVLGGPGADQDVNRDYLYTASNWPAKIGVSQDLLDRAREGLHDMLLDVTAKPPDNVLTTVAGYGYLCAQRLAFPQLLGTLPALNPNGDGDQIVLGESANWPSTWRYVVNCRHTDLPSSLILSGEAVNLLFATGPPDVPPGMPALLPGARPVVTSGAPVVLRGGNAAAPKSLFTPGNDP